MRYVLDACIAVAALKPSEPNHGDALRCVAQEAPRQPSGGRMNAVEAPVQLAVLGPE